MYMVMVLIFDLFEKLQRLGMHNLQSRNHSWIRTSTRNPELSATNDHNISPVILTVLSNPDIAPAVSEHRTAPVPWRTQLIVL